MLKKIAKKDTEILLNVIKLRKEIEENIDKLDKVQAKEKELVDELKNQQSKMQAKIDKAESLLADVNEEIKKAELIKKKSYSMNSKTLSSRSGKVSVRFVSPNFVFPVAGPNGFTDSFGASRPGHLHQGTDIMAAKGTPVVACVSGSVSIKYGSRTSYGGGYSLWLSGNDGNLYYYAHLDTFTVSGGQVSAGQQIGTVGNTGCPSSAPHLHFEIHPGGGSAINPYPILRGLQ